MGTTSWGRARAAQTVALVCALAAPGWAQGSRAQAERAFDQQSFELGLRFVEAQLALGAALGRSGDALRDQSWAAGRLVWLAHETQVEVLARRLEVDEGARLALWSAFPEGSEFEYRVRFQGLSAVHSGVFRHVVRADARSWSYETSYLESELQPALVRAQRAGLDALRPETSRGAPRGFESRWRDLVAAVEARLTPARIAERYALRGELENQVGALVQDVRRDLAEGGAGLLSAPGEASWSSRVVRLGGARLRVFDCAIESPAQQTSRLRQRIEGSDWADRASRPLAPPTLLQVGVSLELPVLERLRLEWGPRVRCEVELVAVHRPEAAGR